MARITVNPFLRQRSLSAGGAATSDPFDLRYLANNGIFSLAASVIAGTAGTVGTTVFTYSGCSLQDGLYVTPSAALAIGTFGTANTSDIISFEPELMPFMKVIATQTGAGTAGKDSVVTAELIMQ